MIGYIKGTVESVDKDKIILECNGIGYNIFVTATWSLKYTHIFLLEKMP